MLPLATASPWTRQPDWMVTAENSLWLATPGGLYRYAVDNETYVKETFPDQPHFSPFEIASDGQQFWVLSESAAGYIDMQTGGRYLYTSQEGLPAGKLTCMSFQGDYVWVGGDSGAARFDRLLEQWETIELANPDWPAGTQQVARIQPAEDHVYLATNAGLLRFDPRTEALMRFGPEDGLKGGEYRDLRIFGEELWCFGEAGIDIYSTRQKSWLFLGIESGLRSTQWQAIQQIGGDLYLLSEAGMDIVNLSSHRLTPFDREERLREYQVTDLIGSSAELWFATERGLLRYQIENPQTGQVEVWQLYDQSRGAAQQNFLRLGGSGQIIIAAGKQGLDVLDLPSNLFLLPLTFTQIGSAQPETLGRNWATWDENGFRIFPGRGTELGLKGNYSYLVQTAPEQTEQRHWGRLLPYFNSPSGRSASGLFDNTDPDRVLYGGTYRGRDGDLLRHLEAGNRIEYSQTYDPFFGGTTLRGGTVMLEAGSRGGEKKRSLLRSNWSFGERLTRSAKQLFNGSQGPIYNLQHQDLLIGSAQVYLNGQLLPQQDYTLNYTLGQLFFTYTGWELLNQGDIIEVEYQYRLEEEQIGETFASGEVLAAGGDALQVAVSAFEKGEDRAGADSSLGADQQALRGAQTAIEGFGRVLGGDGRIVAAAGAGERQGSGEIAAAGSVEGNWSNGAWTFRGKYLSQGDSLPALADRSTEFGALRSEDDFELRFEPSGKIWLAGRTGERHGNQGSERNYHIGSLYSPVQGTSFFGSGDYFDAASDSLERQRKIASLGWETAFLSSWLTTLKMRSSRLTILGRYSEVALDSTQKQDSALVKLRTRSVLARWAIVPGPKASLYPEIRWAANERQEEGQAFLLEREEIAPRGTFYSQNLIPGIITYLYGEASYVQAGYQAGGTTRNVDFRRQGIARIDVAPGVYFAPLKPISLRLHLTRNAEDSLLAIEEDYDFLDLGFSWRDFPTNSLSQRFDSEALQFNLSPHPNWQLCQLGSSLRTTGNPEEQFFSTRIEWRRQSSEQVFWKYTLSRTLIPGTDELRHRPGVEWYRRWSAKLYTRSQFYATIINQQDQQRVDFSPGIYFDRRVSAPGQLGTGALRINLNSTYSRQTRPLDEATLGLSGYTRLDWQLGHPLVLRLKVEGDYSHSFTTAQDNTSWEFEVRLTARF